MSAAEIERRMPVGTPDHVSQTTAVEQSRAVAQVLAAYQRADIRPRNLVTARAEMREVCNLMALAERAFFSYSRGQGNVTGPTIHLARELARIWGNVDYGLGEMRRDDAGLYSEMQAFALDLQTNVRVSTTFTVPHKRDRKKGQEPDVLTDLRDIYENNANMGSRRVRSQIYAILPKWFTDEAEDLCRATLKRGNSGVQLVDRISSALSGFRSIGVTEARIERRLGRKVGEWTADDVVQLGIIYKSIERHEQNVDDAFPDDTVTGAEVLAQARGRKPRAEPAAPAQQPDGMDFDASVEPGFGTE